MIAIILATRAEIIKMSPIIRLLSERQKDYFAIHSGQHYSYDMDKIFFEELKLPPPEFNLDVDSGANGEQITKILTGTEKNIHTEEARCRIGPGRYEHGPRWSAGSGKVRHQCWTFRGWTQEL